MPTGWEGRERLETGIVVNAVVQPAQQGAAGLGEAAGGGWEVKLKGTNHIVFYVKPRTSDVIL